MRNFGFFRCRLKCFNNNISEDAQIEILKRSGNFTTKDEQDVFLQSLIEAHPVKTRRSRIKELEGGQPRPNHSNDHKSAFTFHAVVGEKRIQVCKKAFLSLHAIGEKKVRRLKNFS